MLAKIYEWFWRRIGGRPWTYIIRDSVKDNTLPWALGWGGLALTLGIILAHLFW